ncbi:hypothetical protein [Herbidospora sp. RD11066]
MTRRRLAASVVAIYGAVCLFLLVTGSPSALSAVTLGGARWTTGEVHWAASLALVVPAGLHGLLLWWLIQAPSLTSGRQRVLRGFIYAEIVIVTVFAGLLDEGGEWITIVAGLPVLVLLPFALHQVPMLERQLVALCGLLGTLPLPFTEPLLLAWGLEIFVRPLLQRWWSPLTCGLGLAAILSAMGPSVITDLWDRAEVADLLGAVNVVYALWLVRLAYELTDRQDSYPTCDEPAPGSPHPTMQRGTQPGGKE